MKIFHVIILLLLAAVLAGLAGPAAAQHGKKLYLFNWSQYMNPAIIKAFEKQYHVKVVRNFYGSNPEMFAKLRAGGDSEYDVVFPSDYFVPRLVHSGLLQPLHKSAIPNFDNLMPRFRNPKYDPHSQYTVAYQWGDLGIAYNTKNLPDAPPSWALLFDPSVNKKYPFAMHADAEGVFATACAYQGHGFTCTSRKHWKQAAKLMLKTKQRSNFSGFINGTPVLRRLARGAVDVGVTFNGDYVSAKKQNPEGFANIKFIVPKEGTELWTDTMAIPAHAPHPKLARKFINFILKAKIGAKLSNWTDYASPNKASQPLLDKALQQPPIRPTQAEMKRLYYLPILKGDQLQFVQQLWTEVQAR